MTLSEYLKARGRGSADALAKAVGTSAANVSRWASGINSPSPEWVTRIVDATEGAVTAGDLRPDLAALFQPAKPDSLAAACGASTEAA